MRKAYACLLIAMTFMGVGTEYYVVASSLGPLAAPQGTTTTTTQSCFVVGFSGTQVSPSSVDFTGSYVVFHIQLSNGTVIRLFYPSGKLTGFC